MGLIPGAGGAYLLPRIVGTAKALELFWSCDWVDAREAERIGLVNKVFPDAELMEGTYAFARKVADGAPLAVQTIKRVVRLGLDKDLGTALDIVASEHADRAHQRRPQGGAGRLQGKAHAPIQGPMRTSRLQADDTDMTDTDYFDNFLQPRSVAIVGASPQAGSPRNTLVRNLLKHGFRGRRLPREPEPRRDRGPEGLQDRRRPARGARRRAGHHAGAHRARRHRRVRRARASATRSCSVPASRKSKAARSMRAQLAEAARTHGVAVIGPNCQGFWSVRQKTMLTFSRRCAQHREDQHAPDRRDQPERRAGGRHRQLAATTRHGLSYIVSVGNETCLDALDALPMRHRAGRCAGGGALPRRAGRREPHPARSRSARASAACRSSR